MVHEAVLWHWAVAEDRGKLIANVAGDRTPDDLHRLAHLAPRDHDDCGSALLLPCPASLISVPACLGEFGPRHWHDRIIYIHLSIHARPRSTPAVWTLQCSNAPDHSLPSTRDTPGPRPTSHPRPTLWPWPRPASAHASPTKTRPFHPSTAAWNQKHESTTGVESPSPAMAQRRGNTNAVELINLRLDAASVCSVAHAQDCT